MELLNYYQSRKPFDAISTTNVMREHLTNFLRSRIERDADENVADDVLVISPTKAYQGRSGYITVNKELRSQLQGAHFTLVKSRYSNDRVSYVWNANGPSVKVDEGYCMSIFSNGKVIQFNLDYKVVSIKNKL